MRTAITKLLAATLIVGFTAPAAFADSGFRDHFMTNWDENSDGKVTIEETMARRDAMFTAFDADSDGFLTPEELKMRDQMRAEAWKNMAAQGIQPGHMGHQGPRQGMGRHGQGMHQGMNGHGMGWAMHQGMGRGMGRGMDVDHDSRISKTEFVAMSERWFARFDRNGDKAIDANDF